MSGLPRNDRAAGPSRLPELLAATAVGVYLLLVVGATTAVLDGSTACATWPACNGEWLVGPGDPPALLVAWAHRVLTLVVGGLVLAALALAWRRDAAPGVRRSLLAVGGLYPVQMALGAVAATAGATTALAAAHLVVAMAIFSGVLLALLWQLEAEGTADAVESEPAVTPDRPLDDPAPEGSAPTSGPLPTVRAYITLTKPKLWWLLVLVALAAMGLAAGPSLDLTVAVATSVGGVLAIAASGTFNNVFERDVDRRMARTADRPVATHTVPARRATGFGLLLAAASVGVFVAYVNVLAAALGLLAILFYSVGYTLVLKPNTTQNIVIGGAVGAFPALIGWAAVTDTVGVPAVVLGAVIFLWTPAHFYNLALIYRDDYARAGFPMLPVVRGEAVTRRHVLLYLGATLLGAVGLGATTDLGPLYAGVVTAVGAVFLWAVLRLFRDRSERAAWRAFHASNAFLGSLLLAVILDSLVAV